MPADAQDGAAVWESPLARLRRATCRMRGTRTPRGTLTQHVCEAAGLPPRREAAHEMLCRAARNPVAHLCDDALVAGGLLPVAVMKEVRPSHCCKRMALRRWRCGHMAMHSVLDIGVLRPGRGMGLSALCGAAGVGRWDWRRLECTHVWPGTAEPATARHGRAVHKLEPPHTSHSAPSGPGRRLPAPHTRAACAGHCHTILREGAESFHSAPDGRRARRRGPRSAVGRGACGGRARQIPWLRLSRRDLRVAVHSTRAAAAVPVLTSEE